MSTVDEIEAAISNLAPRDFARVRDWLLAQDNALWGAQIEADSASGKLEHLVQEIEADIAANRIKPVNEVINGS